jgi:rhodanese-related sulfurtransferase
MFGVWHDVTTDHESSLPSGVNPAKLPTLYLKVLLMDNLTVFIANHMGLVYLLAVTMIALMIVEYLRTKRGGMRVDPKAAVLLINKKNAVIIDIRAKESFQGGHIVDAVNSPLSEWKESAKKLDKYKNKPVIIVCGNGTESQKAAANLSKQGYTAVALSGGMRAWSGAELPLVKE